MIEPRFLDVLRKIVARLEGAGIDWAITGSLGLALQGVEVDVHDIDLQTDHAGSLEIERRFRESVVRPIDFSPSDRIRSYLGALNLDGLKVEVIGDMQHRSEAGAWEEPVQVTDHIRWLKAHDMQLPVMSLDHEYVAYLQMGRDAKAQLILAALRRREAGPQTPAS